MLSLSSRQLHFHIMVEFERDLRMLSGPTPFAQSQCPGLCSDSFYYLQGWKIQNLSGSSSQVRKHFLMLRRDPVSLILYPLSLILSPSPTKKNLTFFFAPSHIVLNTVKPLSCRDCSSPGAGLCTFVELGNANFCSQTYYF